MNGERFFRLLGEVDDGWIEEASQIRRPVPWRTLLLSAACLCLMAGLYVGVIRPATAPPDNDGLQVTNPVERWETAEELSRAVGFAVPLPTQLPEGYELEGFATISRQIAEVRYSDGAGSMVYRVSEDVEEVSGDYDQHDARAEIAVDGVAVTLLGDSEGWVTALWSDGARRYALLVQPGRTAEELRTVIASIQ